MREEENKIIENLEEEKELLEEAEKTPLDEVAEALEEEAEEIEKENEEILEKVVEEEISSDESEAVEEELEDIDPHIKNLKKNDAAKLLVKKANIIVNEAETQLEECKLLLERDLQGYESAKQSLKDNGLDASEELLTILGFQIEENSAPEDMVAFEPQEEVTPIHIKDVSSGAFSGFILALIAGIVTLMGLLYAATEKAGITLDLSKVPSSEEMASLLKGAGALVGMPKEPMMGGILIVLSVLLVTFIVYKIRVALKASANINMAKEQLVAAEEYCAQKGSCKKEMDKVDAYINDAIETLKLYKVILSEQRGKLERVLYLEKDKVENAEFHPKSMIEINDTQELVSNIKDFMSVPMSEEGKLSGKSSLFLHRAKSKVQKVIDRLYS